MSALNHVREALPVENVVIFLTNTDHRVARGGLERYMRDEQAMLHRRNITSLTLFPFPTRRSQRVNQYLTNYWGACLEDALVGFYDEPQVINLLSRLARTGCQPMEIQLHNLRDLDLSRVQRFVQQVVVPIRLFLHDYSTICPQFSLLRNNQEYCGPQPPSAEKCVGCYSWTPGYHDKMRALFDSIKSRLRIVAPSRAAREVWLGSFPDFKDQVDVIPHLVIKDSEAQRDAPPIADGNMRFGFIGAPYQHKGWEAFLRLVDHSRRADWPYQFYHLGLPRQAVAGIQNIPVSVVRDGPEGMIRAIQSINLHIAFLWSLCPETYSYTLQECLQTQAMLVTHLNSGNIAETIAALKIGKVLADESELWKYLGDPQQVRCDIQDLRNKPPRPSKMIPNEAILELMDWNAHPDLPVGTGAPKPNRLVGFLYKLKEFKRRLKNQ